MESESKQIPSDPQPVDQANLEQPDDKKVSKNEQKRLKKLEELEKKKKEKEEQKRLKAEQETKDQPKSKPAKPEEEILDPVLYFESRSKVVSHLKQDRKTHPYPHKFHVDMTIEQFRKEFDAKCVEKNAFLEQTVSVAGRVMSMRAMGSNLIFYDLQGDGQKLQIMVNSKNHEGEEDFKVTHQHIRRGDIIGVKGKPGRTATGELSLAPGSVKLLSPCLHMLPGITGLKDQETRYRQRYLDLIINNKTRDIFKTRTQVIKYVRSYLDNLGFLEVKKIVN